jgi:hypothetical protein
MSKRHKPKTLHELLMMHYKECFPLRDVGKYREIKENKDNQSLIIDGHGRFTNVKNYAIIPRNAVPDAPLNNFDGVHEYTPSDMMLYINRKIKKD